MTAGKLLKPSAWLIGSLAGLSVWLLAASGVAQPTREPREPSPKEDTRKIDGARRHVETLYFLRLSERLALAPEQSAQVAAIIRKAQETRRALLEDRRQIVRELSELVAAEAGPDRIKPKVAQWEQNEGRLGRWRQDLFQALSRLLSVEQQGRYVLFDEKFNAELRKAMRELRHRESPREGD